MNLNLAALAEEQRAGIRLATFARLGALAILAFWVAARAVGQAQLYYLSIVAILAVLGLGQLLLSRRDGRSARVAAYGLTLLDMVVLTAALVVPNPMSPAEWPAAMQLRLDNFDFFFIFIGLAVLGFSPGLALWAGIAAAVAWSAGVIWVLAQPESFTVLGSNLLESGELGDLKATVLDPHYVSTEIWVQQVLVALVVAGILAAAVWRSRRLALRQATLARERANLARYFSPSRAEQLARSAEPIGTVRRQAVAVLFVDIVGFTRLCDGLPPDEVIALLRAFHRRMADAVFAHDGTVEKYIGDALMATFGTPQTSASDARDAIACSETMLAILAGWNREREAADLRPISMGIGIHYGDVVLGDIGDARCMEFAVVGDTVNVASHLESLCRQLGAKVVASGDLIARARSYERSVFLEGFVPAASQSLKGRKDDLAIMTYGASGEEASSR
ncbi:MAG: adenylate/guanylate cyclase domain-containing protein [Pseudomonadota bacterium]